MCMATSATCIYSSINCVIVSTLGINTGNFQHLGWILKTILLSPHIYLFSSSNIVANNPFRARYHRWQNSWQTQLYQRMRGFSFALSPRKEIFKDFICIDLFIPQSIVGCPNEHAFQQAVPHVGSRAVHSTRPQLHNFCMNGGQGLKRF